MKKEIIHVIDNFKSGGAQEIIYTICKYKNNFNFTVVILSGYDEYLKKIQPYADIIILSKNKYNFLKIIVNLVKIVKKRNCIINGHLEASTLFLMLIRFFLKFDLVISIHAIPEQLPNWYNVILKKISTNKIIYIVEDKIAYLNLINCNIDDNNIRYIPIGTEKVYDVKEPDFSINDEYNIDKDNILLLNVARMVPAKGQRDLLLLLSELKKNYKELKFHLIIVGYGPEENSLKKLANSLSINKNVTFAGRRTDLHNFYYFANWFLMPCYDESMGVVIYESLAYGIPVIAYDSGSINEVIDDANKGFVVQKHYRNMLDIILKYRPPRKLNLDAGVLFQYSAKRMVSDYLKVYKNI